MLNSSVCWLLIVLVPTMTWMLDLLVMTVKAQYFPTVVDIGMENDRGLGPFDDFGHSAQKEVGGEDEQPHGRSSAMRKPQYRLSWQSIRVLNEAVTDTDRQEMGMKVGPTS